MAIPTPEETARVLLTAMVKDLGMRPGNAIFIQALKVKARERGVYYEDIAPGLERVVENGWLEENLDRRSLHLTEAGFAAAGEPEEPAAPIPAGPQPSELNLQVGDNSQIFLNTGQINKSDINQGQPSDKPASETGESWHEKHWVRVGVAAGVIVALAAIISVYYLVYDHRPKSVQSDAAAPTQSIPTAVDVLPGLDTHTANPGTVAGSVNVEPCGVFQNGGSNNTASTSCTPPARTLSGEQKQGISEFLKTVPGSVQVSIGSVIGASDGDSYANDFFPLFDGRHLDSQTAPSIRTGFQLTFTGVFVATPTDDDPARPYRDALVKKLKALGISVRPANGSKVPAGNLEVIVGFPPAVGKTR